MSLVGWCGQISVYNNVLLCSLFGSSDAGGRALQSKHCGVTLSVQRGVGRGMGPWCVVCGRGFVSVSGVGRVSQECCGQGYWSLLVVCAVQHCDMHAAQQVTVCSVCTTVDGPDDAGHSCAVTEGSSARAPADASISWGSSPSRELLYDTRLFCLVLALSFGHQITFSSGGGSEQNNCTWCCCHDFN